MSGFPFELLGKQYQQKIGQSNVSEKNIMYILRVRLLIKSGIEILVTPISSIEFRSSKVFTKDYFRCNNEAKEEIQIFFMCAFQI